MLSSVRVHRAASHLAPSTPTRTKSLISASAARSRASFPLSLSAAKSGVAKTLPTTTTTTRKYTTKMPRAAETASFKFNHTMLRVKDPKVSLKFYTEVIGMELISQQAFSDFTLYFLAFDESNGKLTAEEKAAGRFAREGVLELTHNHGTENDPNFAGYASGNADPGRGFGHIAITVDDVEKACERFETLGVQFKKRPSDGKMRHIAFILDPDGYWIEVVPGALKL